MESSSSSKLSHLAKDTVVYGAGQIFHKLITFFLLPLFTAYMTPEDYGIVAMLGYIQMAAMILCCLGLTSSCAACYFDQEGKRERDGVIWTSFVLLSGTTFALVTLSVLLNKNLSLFLLGRSNLDSLVSYSAWSALFSIIALPFSWQLKFEKKAKIYVLLFISSNILTILLNVFYVVVLRQGARGWLLANLWSQGVSFLLFFAYYIMTKGHFHFVYARAKELVRVGWPMIPSFGFLFVIQHSGRYFVERYYGLELVGLYSIGYNMGLVMNLFVGAFGMAWAPYFLSLKKNPALASQRFASALKYYVLLFGWLTMAFFLFSKGVVEFLTQKPFHSCYSVIGLIALGYFLTGVSNIFQVGVFFTKKLHYLTFVRTVGVCINLLISAWIVPLYGIEGAACCFVVTNLVLVALQVLIDYVKELFHAPYPWRWISSFVGISAIPAAFSLLPRSTSPLVELTGALVLMGVYCCGTFYMLKREEREVALQWIQRYWKKVFRPQVKALKP